MTKLGQLRSRLSALRRRRQAVRYGAAFCAMGAAVLWLLGAAFLVDWGLISSSAAARHIDLLQRAVSLAICVGVGIWAYRRYARPYLRQRETDLDMAVMVERQQGIDSDLVGALQFEQPEADRWGSRQLEQRVIDAMSRRSGSINVFEGFSRRDLARRAAVLGVTVAIAALLVAAYPRHTVAFLNRFFLGPASYPTRTNIDEVVVLCGHDAREQTAVPVSAEPPLSPERQPLTFVVRWSGEEPAEDAEQRKIEVRTADSGREIILELDRADDGSFHGTLPQLVDSVDFQVFLGDDWTRPARVEMNPLPAVEVTPTVTPPAYASQRWRSGAAQAGARHVTVIEGSEVGLEVRSKNKPLADVVLVIGETPVEKLMDKQRKARALVEQARPLDEAEAEALAETAAERLEQLAGLQDEILAGLADLESRLPEDEALAALLDDARSSAEAAREAIRLPEPESESTEGSRPPGEALVAAWNDLAGRRREIVAEQNGVLEALEKLGERWLDGLPLEKQDEEGRIWALAGEGTPLASATQRVDYRVFAVDHDGLKPPRPISGRVLIKQDQRPRVAAGMVTQFVLPDARPTITWQASDDYGLGQLRLRCEIERRNEPKEEFEDRIITVPAEKQPATLLSGDHQLDLSELGELDKGDRVIVHLEAVDYRGDLPGQPASLSEPLVLRVTDERGVLAAMIEQDKRSYDKLESIIQRQLDSGE